jgi:hypothetical protein
MLRRLELLLKEFCGACFAKVSEGRTWALVLLAVVAGSALLPELARHIPALAGVHSPESLNLLGNPPVVADPVAHRWLRFTMFSPSWVVVVFPSLFVLCAVGVANRFHAALCFGGGWVCLLAFLLARVYLQVQVLPLRPDSVLTSVSAFVVTLAAIALTYVFCVAASRANHSHVGFGAATSLCLGMILLMRIWPGGQALHAGLLLFAAAEISAVLAIAPFVARPVAEPPVEAPQEHVFISYRREDGAETARLFRIELIKHGFRVFLDVEDLRSEHFDTRILREIEAAPHFLLILTKDCLERARTEGDWFGREIAHAIRMQRNIVPILKPGFKFPPRDSLPPDLAELPRYNGIQYFPEQPFKYTIDSLLSFLSKDRRSRERHS